MTIANLVKKQRLRRPPFCASGVTVFEAAVEMAALEVHALAVVDGDKLIGIITDQDIIRCIADSGGDFYEQTVAGWMTENPITCAAGTNLSTALKRMAKHGIRNLVVVQRGVPVTIVGSTEILSLAHEPTA